MGKLLAHSLLAILLYRYYKRAHEEWGAWHALCAGWYLSTLAAAGVGASLFWERGPGTPGGLFYSALITCGAYAAILIFS